MREGISLIFPAYNEEKNIGQTIEKAIAVAGSLNYNYEIIVVDDGSRDTTPQIAQNYARENKNIILRRHGENKGYGCALKTGFDSCRYGLVFFSDADLQFDLAELPSFIGLMQKDSGIDGVIGYRGRRADPLFRRLNAFGWRLWSQVLFGIRVRDANCAFKLFKQEVIRNITIESTGALVSIELLAKAKQAGYRIIERPVRHYRRLAGRQTGAKLSVILKAFYESFKLYRKIKKPNILGRRG